MSDLIERPTDAADPTYPDAERCAQTLEACEDDLLTEAQFVRWQGQEIERLTAENKMLRHTHRWNVSPQVDDSLLVCRHLHEKDEKCDLEHYVPAGRLHDAIRERDELRDVLLRNGFVPCDIPACNCGSWHHRYGLPERMQEIKDELAEAGHELSNANGNLTLNALKALVAERDDLRRKLAESEQRFDWLTERLEDVQIDDVDPNDHYYDGEEDVPFPILWRRAIDAAMGFTRPAEEA